MGQDEVAETVKGSQCPVVTVTSAPAPCTVCSRRRGWPGGLQRAEPWRQVVPDLGAKLGAVRQQAGEPVRPGNGYHAARPRGGGPRLGGTEGQPPILPSTNEAAAFWYRSRYVRCTSRLVPPAQYGSLASHQAAILLLPPNADSNFSWELLRGNSPACVAVPRSQRWLTTSPGSPKLAIATT